MSSCSTSSNIQSALNTFNLLQDGSRLITSISFVSGLTVGDVIRYDVPTTGYTRSIANDASTSEVFGVIESLNSVSNKFNVVIYGSINIPSSKLFDMGSGGGCGGNDIYFLSGVTAGALQNLAPTNLSHIIKPVYQASPHGDGVFTGVVVNYLGYRIGGEIPASQLSNLIGEPQSLIGDNDFEDGVIDASVSHELPLSDYPEFYAKFGTQYGYVEKITVSESIPGSVKEGLIVRQGTSNYSGTITSVDYPNKYIYTYRAPNSPLVSTDRQILINTSSTTNLRLTPTTSSIYSVQSPIIRNSEPPIITGKDNATPGISQKVKTGIRVKPKGLQVTIPESASITSLSADTLIVGATANINVKTKLDNLEARIAVIENRLRIT